ncbi:MAG: CoA transferase [Rhodobacteraceae bacterium]|nr:CoA transferase [Paracoccaceae bacterium]
MKALEDVRILDLTQVQSGPNCAQLLARFGADVFKMGRFGVGDTRRSKKLVDVPGCSGTALARLLNSGAVGEVA